jgi:hypothetical protein
MSETMNRVFWPAQGQGPMETEMTKEERLTTLELLKQLRHENPKAGKAEINRLFRAEVLNDEALQAEVIKYWFDAERPWIDAERRRLLNRKSN